LRIEHAVEKTYGAKVENNAKTIFVFKTDPYNYFESNYQAFDTATDGNYLENCRQVDDILYTTFKTQMPGVTIDSGTSTEIIDGLEFQTFTVTIDFPNKMVLHSRMYSRLFGKRELTVNIMTVDKEKFNLLLDAWQRSTFGKK
jgi:hypothetical protein